MNEENRRKSRGGFEELFHYGGNLLSIAELLKKPEVVNYLKRDGKELNDRVIRARLRRGLRNGKINQQVIMEYAQPSRKIATVKPIPTPRTVKPIPAPRKTKPIPHPRKTKPIPPPRKTRPLPKPAETTAVVSHLLPEIVGDITRFLTKLSDKYDINMNDVVNLWNSSVLNTPKKQPPMFKRRPKPKESKPKEYIPVSPSKTDSLPKPKSRGESAKMDVLRYLGLLDDKIEEV